MSTERMAEIAGRMKAATEGPWKCFYKSKYDEWHVSVPTMLIRQSPIGAR